MCGAKLVAIQLAIQAALCQEFIVAADFHDSSAIQYGNPVCIANRGEPVCDH
jgi:hypothetical protein